MSEHRAKILWKSSEGDFTKGHYSREHTWTFDGGLTVPASASPSIVKAPYSNASSVDPEEAFVASISSCHMLTFVHMASREGLDVLSYEDDAVGNLTKNERGVPWVSKVVLSPAIEYRHAERYHGELKDERCRRRIYIIDIEPECMA